MSEMLNKQTNLINNLIEETKNLPYQDKVKLDILIKKMIMIFAKLFGEDHNYLKEIKSLCLFPTTSFFSEMSEQVQKESWSSGKTQLLSLLNTALEDLKLSSEIVPISVTASNHEETLSNLKNLLTKINTPEENVFFEESIKCFEVGALRASIIMVWNLTINHLFDYILANKLHEFNDAFAKNPIKKIKAISKKDDFNEIPENRFIEYCRSSGIISNDVRKILDTKLGIRNTYAHPSNVTIKESKVIDFIDDMVNNVVLKY